MENIFDALKSFILEDLEDYLLECTDETTPMPMVAEKNIVFGSVDISRLGGKVICSILPENENDDEEELGYRNVTSNVTVTFILNGAVYDVLVRQMARYASAFRKCLLDSPTLNGRVENLSVGERTFYTDAGITEKQMTAVEIALTIFTEEEI